MKYPHMAAAATCFSIALLASHAHAQAAPLRQQLIGTWVLVSNALVGPDGNKVEQFGSDPLGILIYAADGHFATINARSDLPKLTSGNRAKASPEEAGAITAGSLAYYGTWNVSETEKVITVHIDGSTFPNQLGSTQKRVIKKLTPVEMVFANPATTSGGALELVWRRAE